MNIKALENVEQQRDRNNFSYQPNFNFSFFSKYSRHSEYGYCGHRRNSKEHAYRFINCLEQVLICLLNLENYTENFLIFFQNRDVLEKEDNVFFKEVRKKFFFLKLSLEHLKDFFLIIQRCCLEQHFIEKNYGLSVFKKMLGERFFHGKINEELLNVNNTIFFLQLKISKKFSNREEVVLFFLNFKEKWEEVNNLWNEILQTGCLENEKWFLKMRYILTGSWTLWEETVFNILLTVFIFILIRVLFYCYFYGSVYFFILCGRVPLRAPPLGQVPPLGQW